MITVVDWREMFQVQQVEKPFHIETEAHECNANCLKALELKCVCKCAGKNHGAALKTHVQPLDSFAEDPVQFSPEEYLEELVLA